MRHHTQLITQPALEPLELPHVKAWLREDGDGQDSVIQSLIRTAREECENYTGRAAYVATYRDALDAFPGLVATAVEQMAAPAWPAGTNWPYQWVADRYAICLMRSPLIAVSQVAYYDPDGTLQTLGANTDYVVDTTLEPGRITPAAGTNWPATQDRPGAVRITYTAGYASRAAIPEVIKQAMRMQISHWYENREAVITGTISKELELGAQYLLDKVRIMWEW